MECLLNIGSLILFQRRDSLNLFHLTKSQLYKHYNFTNLGIFLSRGRFLRHFQLPTSWQLKLQSPHLVEAAQSFGRQGSCTKNIYCISVDLCITRVPKKQWDVNHYSKNASIITLLRVIPTMTFQNSHVRFYVSLIGSGEGKHTTHLLKCVLLLSTSQTDWKQSSDILSDISFDILSDISSDILSDISFDTLSDISSDIVSDISFDILSDISFDILSDISSDSLSDILLSDTFRGWSPVRNTGLTGSRLRSGAEHWTHRIAVEVRRGTLASQDRGWGPARNTGLGSRSRSGAEHWPHRIAVEVRCGTLASQDRCWGPVRNTDHTSSQDETKEKAEEKEKEKEKETEKKEKEKKEKKEVKPHTLKSNNPHLTGGEWVTFV